MLIFNTIEEHAVHSVAKNIPWLIFSSPDFFNCRVSELQLIRLQGTLEESSQTLRPEEDRPSCAVLCFLFGHWEETDQVLCDAIKTNMKVLDCFVLEAIVASGRTSLLRCYLQSMSSQNRAEITAEIFVLDIADEALSRGDVSVLEIFEEFMPSLITELMRAEFRYGLWDAATSRGYIEILAIFARHMPPEAIKKTISIRGFNLYSQGLMNPNQLPILHYFESFFVECTPEDIILADGQKALTIALRSGHQDILDYFLSYPRVFVLVDNGCTVGAPFKVEQFVQLQLERWHHAEDTLAKSSDDFCFSLQEIELAMLFVRRFIRQDSFEAHEYLRKLLSIQSLAKHMHTDWFPDVGSYCKQPNGLLRLALSERKISIAKCLLSLPAVRELAKTENYYQAEIPPCFEIEAYARKCDERLWSGVGDLERSGDEDCIYHLYQMTKAMVQSRPGRFACPESTSRTFFENYALCAREDEAYHGRVLSHLFSSRYGLMKLFALLERGYFCISYSGNNHQRRLEQFHYNGLRFNRDMVSQEEQQDFECFSNHLDSLINPNEFTDAMDFFHAALLKYFINTYIHPDNAQSFRMTDKPREVWYNLLANDDFECMEYFYVLMRIGGFQIYRENFRSFTYEQFFTKDVTQARAECDFLLDRYMDNFDDISMRSRASKIAAGMAKELLLENFLLDQVAIKTYQGIHRRAQKHYRWDREQLNALSMAQFIKLAGLLAVRFEQYAFFDVLIQLSKELGPVYRYYNTPSLNQGLMPRPGIAVSKGGMNAHIVNHGDFQNALTDIVSLFRSPEIMNEFWAFLESKIEPKLKHAPSVPPELMQNNINFFEINYPGQDTMDWYLSLSPEQRKLNQAVHLTLLELERENGYNLELDSTGDVVPRFHGFVDADYADNLLLSRYLFKECSKYLPGILHGENSHRYQWAAISFFIQRGVIRLPEGKNVHDLLIYVINNKLWSELADHFEWDFGCPHFVASWLRNAGQYPNLQKAMVIGYCNKMNKFLHSLPSENNPWNYERLILMQSCFEEQFSTVLPRIKPDNIRFPMKKFFANGNGMLLWGVYAKDERADDGHEVSDDEIQENAPAMSSSNSR